MATKRIVELTYSVLRATKSGRPSRRVAPCAVVWNFCNANLNLSRKEAVGTLIAQGINYWTARTQYQLWYAAATAPLEMAEAA